MSNFKYSENIIMSRLSGNNIFIKYNLFNTHKENSIGWFKFVNPIIFLQRYQSIWQKKKGKNYFLIKKFRHQRLKNNPVFDIHSKNMGVVMVKVRLLYIFTKFRCRPNDYSIFKILLARWLGDSVKNFSFISFGLIQIPTTITYRWQLIFKNNHVTSIVIILVHRVTKNLCINGWNLTNTNNKDVSSRRNLYHWIKKKVVSCNRQSV